MKTLLPRLAAACLALAAALPLPAAESASVLLQKAIYAEETEGNLDSAIKLYEQIAAEAATNRTIVAQAQYRLAVCYQKKGDKPQAIKLLNELVQQSTDPALRKSASDALVQLGQPRVQGVAIKKLPLSIKSRWFMSITPDGRYFAFQPTDTSDVAVYELASGKSWTVFKGTNENNPESDAIISPDGQWIAYDLGGKAVYVVKIDGTDPRKIYECDAAKEGRYDYTDVEGWSPDSTQLVVGTWAKKAGDPTLVLTVDRKTGVVKPLAELPKTANFDSWALSANQRYLARRLGSYPRKITLLDLKSGREETVVERDAQHIVGWVAADTKLVYAKTVNGGVQLWAAEIKEGPRVSAPELVWSNPGIVLPMGITQEGNIYYALPKNKPESSELWIMEGFLEKNAATRATVKAEIEIPPEEILGPGNSILDRKTGIGLTYPADWEIKSAVQRAAGGRVVNFLVPGAGRHNAPRITCLSTTPPANPSELFRAFFGEGAKPVNSAEIDAWLRQRADFVAKGKMNPSSSFPGYRVSATGYVRRTVNGQPAISWTADFEKSDATKWTDFVTIIYGEKAVALLDFNSLVENVPAIRPGFEQMIETVKLP